MSEVFNIFPTTIFVEKIENHINHKKNFYKLYDKYDYEENEKSNTVSEGQVDPLLHLEPSLDSLFIEIIKHVKTYVLDVLQFKDIFNYSITKTWLSRTRDKKSIPWHIHSTSHISFVYYLNIPPKSHKTIFLNKDNTNSLFLGSNYKGRVDDATMINEFNNLNANTFYLYPTEGYVSLFPSNLTHGTESVDDNFNQERLCIVGDINLILKEQYLHHSMGLIDEKYWKKFS